MFGRFGWAEILIIVVLLMILFGHNKIPGMMRNVADGINVFKRELKDDKKSSKPAAKTAKAAPAKKPVKKSPAKKAKTASKKK